MTATVGLPVIGVFEYAEYDSVWMSERLVALYANVRTLRASVADPTASSMLPRPAGGVPGPVTKLPASACSGLFSCHAFQLVSVAGRADVSRSIFWVDAA